MRDFFTKQGTKKVKQKALDIVCHNWAFRAAVRKVDWVLRYASPLEVGMCFADKINLQREDWLRTMLKLFRHVSTSGDPREPLEHLVDTLYFADSADSFGLQLADSAAFLIKRHLLSKKDSEPFYKLIEPNIMLRQEQ